MSPASEPTTPTLAPDALARALRAVATELECDPALAQRVTSALTGDDRRPAYSAAWTLLLQHITDALPAGAPVAPPAAPSNESASDVASLAPSDDEPATGRPRGFRPRLVTGAPPELGQGIPDPFALRKRLGKDGLRNALAELRLGSLRAIVREHHLDPDGKVSKLNDAGKLRALILAATN